MQGTFASFNITIVRCYNLPDEDGISLPDAYVQMWEVNSNPRKFKEPPTNPKDIKRTNTVSNSLTPQFDETFSFDIHTQQSDPMNKYLMIRIMDDNILHKDKELRQTLPILDADCGTIEVIIKVNSNNNSLMNRPIMDLFDNTFMTVGPVIGVVTSTTARILVECSKPIDLHVEIIPLCERSHFSTSNLMERKEKGIHPNREKHFINRPIRNGHVQHKFVSITKSNVPHVFELSNLNPDFVYRVEFSNISNKKNRVGIIKTMIDDKKLESPGISHYLTVNCVSCNFIERRDPEKDTWERIEQSIDNVDILVHMGDQIYSDYGHNAYDEAMKICREFGNDKLGSEEVEIIKEHFRKYHRFNWNHPATRNVISQVSNIMILDDHEIRDDWGSKETDRDPQSAEFLVGSLARQVYWEYQRSLRSDLSNVEEISKKHEGYYHIIGDVAFLVLDMRVARSFLRQDDATDSKFLSQDQWNDINQWISNGALSSPKIKSLIVVCSVPLIFLSKKITDTLPLLSSELDDLEDHMIYGKHSHEQIQLLETMLKWKNFHPNVQRSGLFLGGDVHIGGSTEIFKDSTLICQQLTSSSICNTPIPTIAAILLQGMIKWSDTLTDGWTFNHNKWRMDRNFGLIEITSNNNEKAPIIHSYLNTFDKAFLN